MKGTATFRCLFLVACTIGCSTISAHAAESPSFTAYSQGQYMTARKLAEREAAQGSKEAYTLLGEIYEEGLGIAQDYKKAADAYRKGAELGDANAQFSLGTLSLDGQGVKKDAAEALRWYRISRERGDGDAADALRRLGDKA